MQQAHTGSFSNACRSNLHNITIAVQNYAQAHGSYPGYLNTLTFRPRPAPGSPAEDRVSWLVPLLPYLERSDIYGVYRTGEYLSSAAHVDPRSVHMQLLVCPANRGHFGRPMPPPCDYIVNAGRADAVARPLCDRTAGMPADWQDNGVFFNHYVDGVENPPGAPLVWQSPDYVFFHDGVNQTLLLSERLDAGSYSYPVQSAADVEAELGFVWWPVATSNPPFNPVPASRRINGPADPLAINNARPSSNHVGGVNVAFCSGNVQRVEANIDYCVWCRLMTPNDAGVNDPGALVRVKRDLKAQYPQEWLFAALRSEACRLQFWTESGGTSYGKLTPDQLESALIPVPSKADVAATAKSVKAWARAIQNAIKARNTVGNENDRVPIINSPGFGLLETDTSESSDDSAE